MFCVSYQNLMFINIKRLQLNYHNILFNCEKIFLGKQREYVLNLLVVL